MKAEKIAQEIIAAKRKERFWLCITIIGFGGAFLVPIIFKYLGLL